MSAQSFLAAVGIAVLLATWPAQAEQAEVRSSTAEAGIPRTLNAAPVAPSVGNADWLPRHDHLDHAVYSLAVTLVVYEGLTSLVVADLRAKKPAPWFSPFWVRGGLAAACALAVGLIKEGLDTLGMGTPEWSDLAADGVGIAVGAGVLLVGRF